MNDAKTIGSNALVLDTAEENVTVMNAEESKLGKEVSLIEQRAEAVVVASGADFEDAGLFLKQIKQAQKQVKDYWEPLRVSAKKSYDEVLAHRKEMIEPLEKAEKIVKAKVNEYSAEQERKRREQEEAMRRLAQAEIDRHLNEAAEAEANGDAIGARVRYGRSRDDGRGVHRRRCPASDAQGQGHLPEQDVGNLRVRVRLV